MKERLIGAAVLVALAVWLIPWVLDGPERPVDVAPEELQLPAAQGSTPMRTQTIRLDEARDPPVPPPPSDASSAATPDPAPVPSARTVESDTPATPPVSTEPETGSEAEGDAWVIQLGSFGDEENARRLADRVATFGFSARVSTFAGSGRPMYRVRVGPEPSRERAVAVASSLSAHGFVAQVVSQD